MSRDLELTVLRDEVEFHRMMADRAARALQALQGELDKVRAERDYLREIFSQALVKGRVLCGTPPIVVRMPDAQ